MAQQGWIKIYRSLAAHDLWLEEPFTRGQAWVDLLMMVNHENKKVMFDGKMISVGKGSRITSIRSLGERWKWSRTKVSNFLSILEAEKMIMKKSDTKKTVITVVNYSKLQDSKDSDVTVKSHRKATEKPQKSTNKNDKNEKNEKNIKGALPRVLPPIVKSGEMTWEEYQEQAAKLRK